VLKVIPYDPSLSHKTCTSVTDGQTDDNRAIDALASLQHSCSASKTKYQKTE